MGNSPDSQETQKTSSTIHIVRDNNMLLNF